MAGEHNKSSPQILSSRWGSPQSVVRENLRKNLDLKHIYDLGDTNIFKAAVLPAVIIAKGKSSKNPQAPIPFTSIYSNKEAAATVVPNTISALRQKGAICLQDGRSFEVKQGFLKKTSTLTDIWTLSNQELTDWFSVVDKFTWDCFSRIGKIRVGVKTCADAVFIKNDWESLPVEERPELLRPLMTHHIANGYKANKCVGEFKILYPHEDVAGKKRSVNLSNYPKAKRYLEKFKDQLSKRTYLIEAGREWYELWVPQDPLAWSKPKMVFRDISQKPAFWMDLSGSVVNGDCYWLTCDNPKEMKLLWLAIAIGNSSFIEEFYDKKFGNKLFAGRRRFITQYVEMFPLPDPSKKTSKQIIGLARRLYENTNLAHQQIIKKEIDSLVWNAFGLPSK